MGNCCSSNSGWRRSRSEAKIPNKQDHDEIEDAKNEIQNEIPKTATPGRIEKRDKSREDEGRSSSTSDTEAKIPNKRDDHEIKAANNEIQSASPKTATPTVLPEEGGTSSSTYVTESKLVTRSTQSKAEKCDVKEEAGSSSCPLKEKESQAENEEVAGSSSSLRKTSGNRILSDGNEEEEEEEILNKETLDSIRDVKEAMDSGHVDVKYIIDRLLAFTNNLKRGNQQLKTEAPPKQHANRFDELINKHMKCIVDRLVAIKKTGIPKQLSKLTAKLLEGIGKRNCVLVVVSFLGWSLNRGLEIRENDKFCMKFLDYIKCLLSVLRLHMPSLEGDTPSDSPLTHIAQEITDGILVCCIYLKGNVGKRFLFVSATQDDLKQVSDFLDKRIQILQLQLNLEILDQVGETNQNVYAVGTKLERQRTRQCNVPQSVPAVGIDDRIAAVIESLEMENDQKEGVAVILHGYAGVGKSTLGINVVTSLYENPMFEFSVASVTVSSDKHDTTVQALELQKQIIRQLLKEKYKVTTVEAGKGKLKEIFVSCPCFLFVDNIVNANQLSDLLPDLSDCSDYKLRILVTSCDLEVRTRMPFRKDLIKLYCVAPLPTDGDSVMLLRKNAGLKDAELDDKEMELISKVATLCHGFPILLSLVGTDLKFHRQEKGYYGTIIQKLEVADYRNFNYNRDIEKVLFSVFTLVDEITQKVFLDICFFFYGWDWDEVCCIIGSISMQKLSERSMVYRSHDDKVMVHTLLKAIAVDEARRQKTRIIINKEDMENEEDEETPENAEDKERIVEAEKLEISDLILDLHPLQELQKIEGLFIYGKNGQEVLLDPKKLPSLRLFCSSNINVQFETDSNARDFHELQFLQINQKAWGNVGPLLLKKQNHFSRMEVLSLNSFEDLHQSPPCMSKFKQLKRLDLSKVSLTALPPKIEVLKYLEFLKLQKCGALVFLPSSIRSLVKLIVLELGYCQSIDSLPPDISGLQELRTLKMASCQRIQSLPKEIGSLRCLEHLDLRSCTQLKSLPPEFGDLTSLKSIDMRNCTGIKGLPNEMAKLASLEELKLTGCSSLKYLPSSVSGLLKLKVLEMDDCDNIETLPEDIRMLVSLEYLLIVSKKLRRLPSSFQGLTSLKKLHIKCEALESLPEDIGMVASLKELVLIDCSALQWSSSSVSGLERQLEMLVILRCENITAHQVLKDMNGQPIEHFDVSNDM